jgi:ADP-ribose pyrophosphatase YjhB (NUDIX family)
MVYALLTDTTGTVLLVRRRGSALWTLPAGELRPGTPTDDLLTAYCQRQTGITPESFGPLEAFTFGGAHHSVATAIVPRTRAGARGRIEAINWARPEALPTETDPVARFAVATMLARLTAARAAAAVVTASAFQSA